MKTDSIDENLNSLNWGLIMLTNCAETTQRQGL